MVARGNIRQYSFTAGILSDTLLSRQDIRQYYAGARDLTNLTTLTQGGVKKRPALAFIDDVDNAGKSLLVRFEFANQQNYLIIFTPLKIHIYYQDQLQLTLDSPYDNQHLEYLDWTQSLDTMIITHPNIHPKRLMRRGAHDNWQIDNVPLTNIPQYKFDGSNNENVWSSTRGYPKTVHFFQGRLYFGGSDQRPQTIWGSRTGDFFNFATSDPSLDDDAVSLTLDGDRINEIQKLYALTHLMVFTNGGLFVLHNTPVTPSNFFLRRNNEQEAAPIKPVVIDNAIHYVSAKFNNAKQAILSAVYDEGQELYISDDISKLTGDTVNKPIDMAVQSANINMIANYLYVVNDDGTIALLNSLRSEKILSWTKLITEGPTIP